VTDIAALEGNSHGPPALDAETRAALEWPALLTALGG
jgi:hypothetical protein